MNGEWAKNGKRNWFMFYFFIFIFASTFFSVVLFPSASFILRGKSATAAAKSKKLLRRMLKEDMHIKQNKKRCRQRAGAMS